MDKNPSFIDWLIHRERGLGFGSHAALAAAAGVADQTVAGIVERASLEGAGRTTRSCLARALCVSVRNLENLASTSGQWIADTQRLDVTRLSPIAPRRADTPVGEPTKAQPGRGVPVVGDLLVDGTVAWVEGWSSEDGARLEIRYPGAADAYALRRHANRRVRAERFVVLRPLNPADLETNEPVLITWVDGSPTGQTRLGIVRAAAGNESLRLQSLHDSRLPERIQRETILRAAGIIAFHFRTRPERGDGAPLGKESPI